MNRIIASLRDGTWLPEARVRRLATAAVAGTIVFLLFLAVTAHGLIDYSGRPLGTDFSSFYAAGRLAGSGADPYDPARLHAMEKAIFGDGMLLTTPFALDYDLMLLAPAILMIVAYMIEKPVIPFGATLVFILWLTPLFVRGIAAAILLPLANWVLAVCFLMLIKQARTQ